MTTKRIRIEEVGDINFVYPYLEVFFNGDTTPFLEVGISDEKELVFKFYASHNDVFLSVDEMETILGEAKNFLPRALKNEEDYLNLFKKD